MRRWRLRLAIVLPLAVGLSITLASSAMGVISVRAHVYSAVSATISPDRKLGNNEYIKVSWRNVGAFQPLFFRQCDGHPTNLTRDCTHIYSGTGFTNSDGSGTSFQPVSQGDVLSQDHHVFLCDSTHRCTFAVLRGSALKTGRLLPIRFARTADDCPSSSGAAIAGGGADQAAIAIQAWSVVTCQAPQRLGVNYIAANSPDGMTNFVKRLNDFAVTGAPFPKANLQQLSKAGRRFKYAPLTASGLVLAYKVFDQNPALSEPGTEVTNLKLTPQLVAQIFTGQITNWGSDPDINALNPGHTFPPTVTPLVRGDHSVANEEFTSWLTATGGSGLPSGWTGPSFDYPLNYISQTGAIVGGDNLAQAIANPAGANLNADWFNAGYIGFIDSSEAAYFGLPTVRIENAAGHFVRATPAAVRAALSHATRNPDGVTVTPDYTTKDPAAYPMPMVDYATVPTNHVNPHRGYTLRQFLDYAMTAGQKQLPRGYTPLPAGMVSETMHDLALIPAVAPPAFGGGGGGPAPGGGGATGGVGPGGTGHGGSGTPSGSGAGGSNSKTKVGHLLSSVLDPGNDSGTLPVLAALCLLGIVGGLLLERGWIASLSGIGARIKRFARRPRLLAWRRP